jgi:hypothetical protein
VEGDTSHFTLLAHAGLGRRGTSAHRDLSLSVMMESVDTWGPRPHQQGSWIEQDRFRPAMGCTGNP